MGHPYSGAAGYIYANSLSTADDEPVVIWNGYPGAYQSTQWVEVTTPTRSVSNKTKRRSLIPDYNSTGSTSPFSPDIRSHKFKIFSTTSYGKSALNSQRMKIEPPPFVYESIMVTFDTPDASVNVVAWRRRQMRALKRLLKRFRRGISRIFTPSWINTPQPRLSMIQ